jgi:hypothetical protein
MLKNSLGNARRMSRKGRIGKHPLPIAQTKWAEGHTTEPPRAPTLENNADVLFRAWDIHVVIGRKAAAAEE